MNKYEENVKKTNIVIRVNTEGYSAASFTAAAIDTLIRRGEEAAMEHWDEIVALRKKLGPANLQLVIPQNSLTLPPAHEGTCDMRRNHRKALLLQNAG